MSSRPAFPSLATECFNKWLLRTLFPGRYPGKRLALETVTDVDSVIGACLAVRRSTIDRVGGWVLRSLHLGGDRGEQSEFDEAHGISVVAGRRHPSL